MIHRDHAVRKSARATGLLIGDDRQVQGADARVDIPNGRTDRLPAFLEDEPPPNT